MTRPNDKAITQEDVAHHAGVSRSIVSYVINNGPRKVSDETRNRVLAAIKDLGYRPNKHAQMLSSADDTLAQKYIGIILASNFMFKRPYYGSILASIHEHAHERDCHIRFIRVFEDFNNPMLFNELIHPNEISSAILLGLDQVLNTPDDRMLVEEIVEVARNEGLERVEAEFLGEQEAGMKLFAMTGFSHLLRLEDHVKDMQAITHDYVLMEMQLTTDEEYASAF